MPDGRSSARRQGARRASQTARARRADRAHAGIDGRTRLRPPRPRRTASRIRWWRSCVPASPRTTATRRPAITACGARRPHLPVRKVGMAGGALSSGLSDAIESRRGRGSALPTGVRQRMESAFGRDLGNMSVHADEHAAHLSRAVSAKAFTTGNDIFFGANQFRPDTPSGERMLARELAHGAAGQLGRAHRPRMWDIKSSKVGLHRALVRAFPARNIYFMVDHDGDEVVVKSEDQPVVSASWSARCRRRSATSRTRDAQADRAGARGGRLAIDVTEVAGRTPPARTSAAYLKRRNGADPATASTRSPSPTRTPPVADKTEPDGHGVRRGRVGQGEEQGDRRRCRTGRSCRRSMASTATRTT